MIGAGPVGYVLSILLAKRGYSIDLFEKREDPLESSQVTEGRTANFLYGVRSVEAFRRVGLGEEALKYGVRIDNIKYIKHKGDAISFSFRGKDEATCSYSINRASI